VSKAPITADPPAHLDDAARQKWADVLPGIAQRENIDQGALDALAAYCLAYSRWQAAEVKVSELGAVVKAGGGAVVNPYIAVARQAQAEMRKWATELRLTPKARKR
jgi:P27 family predicted phage terminase small subunit